MITSALITYLKANLSTTSIYAVQAPQGILPAVTVDDNGENRGRAWVGGRTSHTYSEQEYEVSCWADDPLEAARLADEITSLLDDFAGVLSDTSVSPNVDHSIKYCSAENIGSDFSKQNEVYGHSVFLQLTHS